MSAARPFFRLAILPILLLTGAAQGQDDLPQLHAVVPHPAGIAAMSALPQLYKWDDVVVENVRDGISRKYIAGDREMVAQITLKRGAIVPEHSHESEQLTYVLTGALKFTLDGRDITVRPGELLRIPSCSAIFGHTSSVWATTDCSGRTAPTARLPRM